MENEESLVVEEEIIKEQNILSLELNVLKKEKNYCFKGECLGETKFIEYLEFLGNKNNIRKNFIVLIGFLNEKYRYLKTKKIEFHNKLLMYEKKINECEIELINNTIIKEMKKEINDSQLILNEIDEILFYLKKSGHLKINSIEKCSDHKFLSELTKLQNEQRGSIKSIVTQFYYIFIILWRELICLIFRFTNYCHFYSQDLDNLFSIIPKLDSKIQDLNLGLESIKLRLCALTPENHNNMYEIEELLVILKKKLDKNISKFKYYRQEPPLNFLHRYKSLQINKSILICKQINLQIINLSSMLDLLKSYDQFYSILISLNEYIIKPNNMFYSKLMEIETYLTSLSSITKDNCLKLTENLRTGCIILRNRSDYHLKMLFNPEKTFEILRVKEKIKEAEDYSQRIHLHLENNCLESSQIVDLISNIHILIDYFEKIACLKLFSDELNEKSFLVKTQLKKDEIYLSTFEELKGPLKEQIQYSSLSFLINLLKPNVKIQVLKPFIKKLENSLETFTQKTPFNGINTIILRIEDILPILQIFQEYYEHFLVRFENFSSEFESIRQEIWDLKQPFKIKISKILKNREDKVFFISCLDVFISNLKKHYESLIPENLDFLVNETKHLKLELEGRINFFYHNRENMGSMALSLKRLLNIKTKISNYFEIIAKNIHFFEQEKTLVLKNTLKKILEMVNKLEKLSEVTLLLDNATRIVMSKDSPEQRLVLLKTFTENLEEKTRILSINKPKEGMMCSIYIYALDDIQKIIGCFRNLIPDIEKFIYFSKDFLNKYTKIVLKNQDFLLDFKNFLCFQREIHDNPNTHRPIIFTDHNKINDFIQTIYTQWYSDILIFLNLFDFDLLYKIYLCMNILSKNSINSIDSDINTFINQYNCIEIEDFQKNDFLPKFLTFKERTLFFKEKLENIQLSVFLLENSKEIANEKYFNSIENLVFIKEELINKKNFASWLRIFAESSKIFEFVDRINRGERSFYWRKILAIFYLKNFESKITIKLEELAPEQLNFIKLFYNLMKYYYYPKRKLL